MADTSFIDNLKTALSNGSNWTSITDEDGNGVTIPATIELLADLKRAWNLYGSQGQRTLIIFNKEPMYATRSHAKNEETLFVRIRITDASQAAAESLAEAVRRVLSAHPLTGYRNLPPGQYRFYNDPRNKLYEVMFNLYFERKAGVDV